MSPQRLKLVDLSDPDSAGEAMRGSYSGKSLVESLQGR
jgi:hypothetical protein